MASGLIASMTPRFSTSKFHIHMGGGRLKARAGSGIEVKMYVSINGGSYASAYSGNRGSTFYYTSSTTELQIPVSFVDLYTPSSAPTTIAFQPYWKVFGSPGGGGNPSGLNPRSLAISIAVTPHPKNGTALRSDNPAPVISPCDALYAASPNAITVPTPGTSLPVFATALVALLVANFLVALFPVLLASFLLILFHQVYNRKFENNQNYVFAFLLK